MDPETHARLEALLEAAGEGGQPSLALNLRKYGFNLTKFLNSWLFQTRTGLCEEKDVVAKQKMFVIF